MSALSSASRTTGRVSCTPAAGWAGALGTYFWIDPKEDIVVIAMTQHMGAPAAEEAAGKIRTLVYSALIDNSNKH